MRAAKTLRAPSPRLKHPGSVRIGLDRPVRHAKRCGRNRQGIAVGEHRGRLGSLQNINQVGQACSRSRRSCIARRRGLSDPTSSDGVSRADGCSGRRQSGCFEEGASAGPCRFVRGVVVSRHTHDARAFLPLLCTTQICGMRLFSTEKRFQCCGFALQLREKCFKPCNRCDTRSPVPAPATGSRYGR